MATSSVAVIILLAYMPLGSSQLINHSVLHPDDMRKAM